MIYVVLGVIAVVGTLMALVMGLAKASARADEQSLQTAKSLEDAKDAQKTAEDVARLPDAALDDELRQHQRG